jgi:nitroreductase
MLSPFADDHSLFRIIRAAQRAPSVYNTQPWSFWIRADDRIELRPHMATEPGHPGVWLDRQLQYTDEAARELTISCGAALFNLRMAIRVTGHDVAVWLLPDPVHDPTLLASVEIVTSRTRAPTAEEQELYEAIPRRHTYRRPFRRQVPHNIITALLRTAAKEKGWLRELYPFQVKDWLRASARAEDDLRGFPWYMTERQQWTNRGDLLGMSEGTYGPQPASRNAAADDFSSSSAADWLAKPFESHPQLLSLATDYNRPLDWLRAGQALQRVLLTAARYDVAASFLTQSLEFADHQQLVDSRRAGHQWPPDRVLIPGRIKLADDRQKSRRWPQARGSTFAETPQMLIRVGHPDCDGPESPRENAPQVMDLRSGKPRPVPPPELLELDWALNTGSGP